ncbi:HLA class II histocompatibility antigen, DR beta 4 chain [Sarracenia purpurea var. burkii]
MVLAFHGMYSCESEGPPHASRFKSKVIINGITFESPEFFSTIKEAEHAAAKVAWESLSTNEIQEDDCGLYKNLLQEFAQREGFNVPVYNTIVSGSPHSPTFVSTVEIVGKSFEGQAAKSKKQAEMSAAKIAYYGLQERCQNKGVEGSDCGEPLVMENPGCQNKVEDRADCGEPPVIENPGRANLIPPTILPSGCQIKEALEISSSILQSVIAGDLKQSFGSKPSLVIKEDQNEEYTDGNGQKFSSKLTTGNAEVGNRHSPDSLREADINAKRHRCSPLRSPNIVHPSFRDQFSLSSSSPEASVSSPSANLGLNIEPPAGASGTNGSPREKILVYPYGSNMSFPDGATVLPFSDDKWVALKMDSSQQ